MVGHIRHEMKLHLEECKELGLTEEMIVEHEESQGKSRALVIPALSAAVWPIVLINCSLYRLQPIRA
jgi:hypothetical protein